MNKYYWDDKLEYLTRTRDLYYNDDYLEFLVKSVWKIDKPVSMVDYGCGYGYLGLKLLPLLPHGSSYTGIDMGEQLIRNAEELFQNLPYQSRFIQADINTINLEEEYDIALCHAFLLHVNDPIHILQSMISRVKDGGKIICFEPHWISTMSSYYINNEDQSKLIPLGFLQKLYEQDTKRDGKDGNIGIKLPIYLSELGVKGVQCRVSDKVNFLDSNDDTNLKLYESLKMDGFGEVPGEETEFINRLMERGATFSEAKNQYDSQLYLSKLFSPSSSLTYAPNMKITFGTVKK
ncbi:class I SAM-dependent methyltransferase [Heyndrickxia sp. NPDC080065]|uniref:class I SAM-dependent methyltransferase n=1 Tax=Heyndrickxia sp. NPDC080065 TaxID=3390568 RepID=UPI003D001034